MFADSHYISKQILNAISLDQQLKTLLDFLQINAFWSFCRSTTFDLFIRVNQLIIIALVLFQTLLHLISWEGVTAINHYISKLFERVIKYVLLIHNMFTKTISSWYFSSNCIKNSLKLLD